MNRNPFAAIEVLLIDGNNLLHRTTGGAGESALRGLLPRLAALIPPSIDCILMLDGHAAMGSGRVQKIRNGLEVRHAGSRSADDALLQLVRDRTQMTTLVSDDRALRDKARSLGASTQRLEWLENILGRGGASPGIGQRR